MNNSLLGNGETGTIVFDITPAVKALRGTGGATHDSDGKNIARIPVGEEIGTKYLSEVKKPTVPNGVFFTKELEHLNCSGIDLNTLRPEILQGLTKIDPRYFTYFPAKFLISCNRETLYNLAIFLRLFGNYETTVAKIKEFNFEDSQAVINDLTIIVYEIKAHPDCKKLIPEKEFSTIEEEASDGVLKILTEEYALDRETNKKKNALIMNNVISTTLGTCSSTINLHINEPDCITLGKAILPRVS